MVGGTEVQTLNLVRALVEAGHEVATMCYFEHCQAMIDQYQEAGSKVILLSSDGTRPHGKAMVKMLWSGLRRVVKEAKPDVVHVQYMAPGAIPILMLRAMGVKNIIATAHTAADIYHSLRLVHFIQRHCVRAWTCISERAEKSFFGSSQVFTPEKELKKRNHFTIFNALPSHIVIRDDERDLPYTLTIGVVSRLEPIKGMDLVVPAFAKVIEKFGSVESPRKLRLLIVGDGSLRGLMEQQTKEHGVVEFVELVGRKNAEELQTYYDQIDILLMPSRSEGFGLTAIEGMARGCVVIASNVGGLPEVVTPEVGLLHESESVEDMAEKIYYLCSNPQILKNKSKSALKRVLDFEYKHFVSQIQSLYSKL